VLAVIAVAVLLVPLRVSILVGWSERPRFEIRIWGLALRRRTLPSWLGRLGSRLIQWVLDHFPRKDASPVSAAQTTEKPRKGPGGQRLLRRFGWWGLRVLGRFLSRFTRRLDIQVGGIDPAVLGLLTGVVAGAGAALGLERLRWIPRFEPGPFRLLFRWTVSISLWGLFLWLGRAAASFPRRPKDALAR
jgi:hypothetical protein